MDFLKNESKTFGPQWKFLKIIMKAYKIEILVIDFDELGPQSIVSEIENVNYPNDCLSPQVKSIIEKDNGEWFRRSSFK